VIAALLLESEAQMMDGGARDRFVGPRRCCEAAPKARERARTLPGDGLEASSWLRAAGDSVDLPGRHRGARRARCRVGSRVGRVLQVGARNMQNFMMLEELGKMRKPILLKRGLSATSRDAVGRRVRAQGAIATVILCERGIRTFETYTRQTPRPVGSRGAQDAPRTCRSSPTLRTQQGGPRFIASDVRASITARADGVMVEVHPIRARAL